MRAVGLLLVDAQTPAGWDTYRGYRSDWSGEPDTAPTATATHNPDGTTTVHAIWNGATDISDWRVLAGPDATSLAPVPVQAWNGLDTSLMIAGVPTEVEIVALDAKGRVLASSAPAAAA